MVRVVLHCDACDFLSFVNSKYGERNNLSLKEILLFPELESLLGTNLLQMYLIMAFWFIWAYSYCLLEFLFGKGYYLYLINLFVPVWF